jgi:hypothetical protein
VELRGASVWELKASEYMKDNVNFAYKTGVIKNCGFKSPLSARFVNDN